ncbi:MAG: hypothetical protein R3C49_19110 [Planctomycetaceae bacterium]
MFGLIVNKNDPPFGRFRKPKPSPLRRIETQSSRRGLPNLSVMLTASSIEAGFLFGNPLVVTTSRPQATMDLKQDSVK